MATEVETDAGELYDEVAPLYDQLRSEVQFAIRQAVPSAVKLHSLDSRLKTRESFVEKAARQQASNSEWEIEDLAGIRVCLLVLAGSSDDSEDRGRAVHPCPP